MRNLSFIPVLLCSLQLWASEPEPQEILRRMQEVYKVPQLEYNCTYTLFKGHESQLPENTYQGHIYRDPSGVYQQIDQTELVYASGYFLQIDNESRELVLSKPQKLPELDINPGKTLEMCTAVTMATVGKEYELTLLFNATSPFSQVKMRVDKKTYELNQLDLYYASELNFSTDFRQPDYAQSHLRIAFTALSLNPAPKPALFALNTYVTAVQDKITPAPAYAGYILTDKRSSL